MSERTIKVDRARVMKQLGVRSLADLPEGDMGEAARAPVGGFAPVATAGAAGTAAVDPAPPIARREPTAPLDGTPLAMGVAASSAPLALGGASAAATDADRPTRAPPAAPSTPARWLRCVAWSRSWHRSRIWA